MTDVSRGRVATSATPAALAETAAQQVIALAKDAVDTNGRFTIALAGGSTPKALYELLAQPSYRDQIAWEKVHVFWSDERFVPLDDVDSCYRMAREALLDHVPLPAANIYPMPTIGSDPETAAQAHAAQLSTFFETDTPRFDLILLGMGPDGHTASLFPHAPAVSAPTDALVVPVFNSPKPPPTRLSFTYRLINAAANVTFLVAGADKAATLRRVLQDPPNPVELPSQGVQLVRGTLTWFVDVAAATELA